MIVKIKIRVIPVADFVSIKYEMMTVGDKGPDLFITVGISHIAYDSTIIRAI